MEISPDPDERTYFASRDRWPPIVTHICGTNSTPPCRFLLPLRISEQESKARIHFLEILHLARQLHRILVLPNVGKSRIGTCFKLDFETYYDLEKLADDLATNGDGTRTVRQDLFRRWADAEAPGAQIAFITAKPDHQVDDGDSSVFFNADASIRVPSKRAADSDMDLPGCFTTKLQSLRLDAHSPLHIHLKPLPQPRLIGTSILDALTRPKILAASSRSELEAPVLVLTWDLRHPIFAAPTRHASTTPLAFTRSPPPSRRPSLRRADRAPALRARARRYACTAPARGRARRLVRERLPARCAPQSRGYGIRGVTSALKSGTFHNAGPLHAAAVGIFGDAFAPGGELEDRTLMELDEARVETLARGGGWEPELLEDVGVRGIVDKIIGMRATLFVSGAPGCGRASSFTRQVLDERREALRRTDGRPTLLQNVVDLFG
ncbi:hypothetical protein B0H10DRAFT_2216362 [Mycena sp. CBHHK59/15]|nr:hypothetical protein B0H10DRAFT_2216362 [Mycena sp. CBHHK59/15]